MGGIFMMEPSLAVKGERPARQGADILRTLIRDLEGPGPECLICSQGLAQVSDAAKTPIAVADATGIVRIRHIAAAGALVGQFTHETVRADKPNAEVAGIGVIGSEVNFDELKVGDSTVWGRHGICHDTTRNAKAGTVGYLDARGTDEGTADLLFCAPTDRHPCLRGADCGIGVSHAKAIPMVESNPTGRYPAGISGMILSRRGRQDALNIAPGEVRVGR